MGKQELISHDSISRIVWHGWGLGIAKVCFDLELSAEPAHYLHHNSEKNNTY